MAVIAAATESIPFTPDRIERLEPAFNRRYFVRDTRCPDLWLQVTATGSKTFYVYRRVNGRPARIRIGRFPTVGLNAARKQAQKIVGEISNGADPRASRRELRHGTTLGELFGAFLEHHAKPRKRTWRHDERQFKLYLTAWKPRLLSEIRRHHVAMLHERIGRDHGQYAANRLLALLHTMYEWAASKRDWKGGNPAHGIERFDEHKRERFLSPAEMPSFFAALLAEPNETIRDYLLFSLLTGARRSNVQAMQWAELDFAAGTWTIPRSKSGKSVILPLAPAALDLLIRRQDSRRHSPSVFPSYGASGHLEDAKTAWKNLLERAGIENLRLHDLRRTFGSWQAAGGASLPIIGKSLGHLTTAATEVYARLHLDPVRASVNAAAAAIVAAGKGKTK